MRLSPSSISSSEFGGMERSTSTASKSDDGDPTDSSRLRDGSVRSAEGRRMLAACPTFGVVLFRTASVSRSQGEADNDDRPRV